MTARKKASVDLCGKIFAILQEKARQAEKEIQTLCECAEVSGEIAQEDYFKVQVMGMVRHHFVDEHDMPQNEIRDGNLINHKWPEKRK